VPDEFDGWYRVGGKTLQFYATDDEIAEWLLEALPSERAPYAVIGQESRGGRRQSLEFPLAAVAAAFSAQRLAVYWIRSDALSPGLTAESEKRLSFNGLINVQLGSTRPDGLLGEASIGIVDRIRHEHTGEERVHTEYLRIFERLRRSMRKRLVVETERMHPDGKLYPDWRMTPRAADAHVRGVVAFAADPVGLRP
jgi:hypothetical protein